MKAKMGDYEFPSRNLTVGKPMPPGELLNLCLETREILIRDITKRMGIPREFFENIVNETNLRLFEGNRPDDDVATPVIVEADPPR